MHRGLAVVSLSILLLTACGAPNEPPAPAPEAIALIGATVLTGSGEAIKNGGVLIKEGRIVQVGPANTIPLEPTTTVVDFTTKYLTPGLIDVHCHYPGDREAIERLMRLQLYYGITAARSAGGDGEVAMAVMRDAQAGRIPAPRMYSAGLGFSHPEGHPVAYDFIHRPESREDARAQVAKLAGWKVDFVKMWVDDKYGRVPKIAEDVRAAIVEEAMKQDLRPMAHIFEESDLRQLIEVGVKDFLHTVRKPLLPGAGLFALCKEKGVSFAATLSIIESNWRLWETPELLDVDYILRKTIGEETRTALLDEERNAEGRSNPDIPMLKQELEVAKRFIFRAHEEGVALAVGSDSGTAHVPAGWGTLREMELLADAGIGAEDIFEAATAGGAALLPERDAPLGLLAEGYAADLLVLGSDPRDSTNAFRALERVMQGGRWIDRSRLARANGEGAGRAARTD